MTKGERIALERVAELARLNAEMVAMLERVQYNMEDDTGCPVCGTQYGMGHSDDCELADLLKRARQGE